jgi:PAS domain S-box-containing protein
MERFGIKESALPEGSIVLNRQVSLWEQYGSWLLGILMIGGLQTGLILVFIHLWKRSKKDRDALHKSDSFLRALKNNIPDLVWLKDGDGVYLSCNPMFEKFFGAKEQLIIGRRDHDFVDTEQADHFLEYDRKVMEVGRTVAYEEWLVFADTGQKGLFETIKTPMYDEMGKIIGVLGIAREITERKHVEQALKNSEERFRVLFDQSPDPLFIWRMDDKLLDANLAACHLLGYEKDELLQLSVADIQAPSVREIPGVAIISELKRLHFEGLDLHKDGTQIPVEIITVPIQIGNQEYAFSAVRDITARKRAEQELQLMSQLIENADSIAVFKDPELRYLAVNNAYLRLTGRKSLNDVIGKTDKDLFKDIATAEQIETYMSNDRAAQELPAGQVVTVIESLSMDGGAPRTFLTKKFSVYDRDAKTCLGVATLATEITDIKRMETALFEAKEKAEAASKTKSEFLANMSHEIRTPLNGIMGMMQLLESSPLDEEQKQYVLMALKSTNRLTRLLSDILDLSRVEAGKMTIHEAEFVPHELVDSVSELFHVTVREKGIPLKCFIDSEIPVRLFGDDARVRQILFNLVGNALKFTLQGHVRLEVSPVKTDEEGVVRVLFSVSDTGIGIPDDKLDGLFMPFAQVDNSYTRDFQGAGLGLAIVKRLVDLLGGKISVESTLGTGTTVSVLLSFKMPEDKRINVDQSLGQLLQVKHGLRILLAEDEPLNSYVTTKLLEKVGHSVTLAENGQQVIEILAVQDFDVILMDIQMPIMNGVETTKAIRQSSTVRDKKDIFIVAMTAYAMAGDREKFLDAGMNDYIAKPIQIEKLNKALDGITKKSGIGGLQ